MKNTVLAEVVRVTCDICGDRSEQQLTSECPICGRDTCNNWRCSTIHSDFEGLEAAEYYGRICMVCSTLKDFHDPEILKITQAYQLAKDEVIAKWRQESQDFNGFIGITPKNVTEPSDSCPAKVVSFGSCANQNVSDAS